MIVLHSNRLFTTKEAFYSVKHSVRPEDAIILAFVAQHGCGMGEEGGIR